MTRNLFIFLGTFFLGALIAFASRAALHKPQTAVGDHAAAVPMAMVGNALTPAGSKASVATSHEGHDTMKAKSAAKSSGHEDRHGAAVAKPVEDKVVNTVCAICGMKVDPNVPTMEFQGKKIGFGCKMCAPKVQAEPEKYGPYYLRNEVIKR